ncbi:hypothetical protein [Fodinibius sp. SL11]|uniref:hypothetical protein n=1 Tax=Fodinibius sp. SL11 TaxID=3425690 RepID=UPI003F882AAF
MGIYAKKIQAVEDTIADGATTSNGVKKEGMRAVGVIIPSGLAGTNLNLEASFDNGNNWHTVIDDGTEVVVKATSVGFDVFKIGQMEALKHVRLVSDTAQTGAVTLTWIFRP